MLSNTEHYEFIVLELLIKGLSLFGNLSPAAANLPVRIKRVHLFKFEEGYVRRWTVWLRGSLFFGPLAFLSALHL